MSRPRVSSSGSLGILSDTDISIRTEENQDLFEICKNAPSGWPTEKPLRNNDFSSLLPRSYGIAAMSSHSGGTSGRTLRAGDAVTIRASVLEQYSSPTPSARKLPPLVSNSPESTAPYFPRCPPGRNQNATTAHSHPVIARLNCARRRDMKSRKAVGRPSVAFRRRMFGSGAPRVSRRGKLTVGRVPAWGRCYEPMPLPSAQPRRAKTLSRTFYRGQPIQRTSRPRSRCARRSSFWCSPTVAAGRSRITVHRNSLLSQNRRGTLPGNQCGFLAHHSKSNMYYQRL